MSVSHGAVGRGIFGSIALQQRISGPSPGNVSSCIHYLASIVVASLLSSMPIPILKVNWVMFIKNRMKL